MTEWKVSNPDEFRRVASNWHMLSVGDKVIVEGDFSQVISHSFAELHKCMNKKRISNIALASGGAALLFGPVGWVMWSGAAIFSGAVLLLNSEFKEFKNVPMALEVITLYKEAKVDLVFNDGATVVLLKAK